MGVGAATGVTAGFEVYFSGDVFSTISFINLDSIMAICFLTIWSI